LTRLADDLDKAGFNGFPEMISMLIFKEERILELYGVNQNTHLLIKTYPITAFSGKLGPKLKEGDRQIPEGIYQIEYLNPNSSYHLSAKVNYPNSFDRQMAKNENRTNLGGDIFIHGKNKTIGCVPVGDRGIEELFILISHVLPARIEVIISPWDFRKKEDIPKIEKIDWELKIYDQIKAGLSKYKGLFN
jgi:murein L,D-transpeptidase YafK